MGSTETCSRCKQDIAVGTAMVGLGILCMRCYTEDPYSEEARAPKPKRVRPVPYTTKKAWGAASAARMRAVQQAPVLTPAGVPMPKGAKVTERDGECWDCRQPVLAGEGEAIWNGARHRQQAACPACTWRSAYMLICPGITRDEALVIARKGLSMGILFLAQNAGYDKAEILAGILTPAVLADLPIAVALNAGNR